MVTGEPIPVTKKTGDTVIGATINQTGAFRFRATKVGRDTMLAQIVRLVESGPGLQGARSSGSPTSSRATSSPPSWSSPSGPSSSGSSLGPAPALTMALVAAVSVLIIACPCALGLATPLSIMVGTGKGATHGILIRSAEALETAHKLDTVILDKTGTITKGKPALTDVAVLPGTRRGGAPPARRLGRAAPPSTPSAAAIVARRPRPRRRSRRANEFDSVTGKGVRAAVDGRDVLVGNAGLLEDAGIAVGRPRPPSPSELSAEGKTPMLVAIDGSAAGAHRRRRHPQGRVHRRHRRAAAARASTW